MQSLKNSGKSIKLFLGISTLFVVAVAIVRAVLFPDNTINGIEVNNLLWDDSVDKIDEYKPNTGDISVVSIPAPEVVFETMDWIEQNLYKVESYQEQEDGKYKVTLLNIEHPKESNLDDLVRTFRATPFSEENHYFLDEGVNCQGMVYYISLWCVDNGIPYKVKYYSDHVVIEVSYDGREYLFNFTGKSEVIIK